MDSAGQANENQCGRKYLKHEWPRQGDVASSSFYYKQRAKLASLCEGPVIYFPTHTLSIFTCKIRWVHDGLWCYVSPRQLRWCLTRFMPLRQKRMPPRHDTNTSTLPRIEAELRKRISQAIARHEAIRFKHSNDTTGNNPPTDCTYEQHLNYKPLNFDGTGGAVTFVRWSEKIDFILRMTNCSPQQSVTFTSGSFLDGTLSW